jgi:hypothetical protein
MSVKRRSFAALVGALCCVAVLVPAEATAAVGSHSGLAGTHVSFTGSVHQLAPGAALPSQTAVPMVPAPVPRAGVAELPFRTPTGAQPTAGPRPHAPAVAGVALTGSPVPFAPAGKPGGGFPATGFTGLNQRTSTALNGGLSVTPPDQGLCVGTDPTTRKHQVVVFNAVNLAIEETTTTGRLLYRASLATWFQDPGAFGDVRCLYDATTRAFYFTDIRTPGGFTNPTLHDTSVDVAVLNTLGLAEYSFPTSETGTCLGDQPKTGFDADALVVSTDEYCGPNLTIYGGALIDVVSLFDLDTHRPAFMETFRIPTMAGLTALGLDPAIGSPGTTAYLVNSFPYATPAFTVAYTTINLLGVWSLSGTRAITSGRPVVLTGFIIGSETYAAPVPARSTATTTLNPDDSRTSGPVTVQNTRQGPVLWTAVTTSVLRPGGTPFNPTTLTDGVAWFAINADAGDVAQQGYVAAPRTVNLIYPAVAAQTGALAVGIVFTATSPTLNPSAAYTVLGTKSVTVAAKGSGALVTPVGRWGDYSFAETYGGAIWMATEYIPPRPDWLPYSNWGTYVFQVH